jgi:thiamine biosynthesis lipoprotein
LKSLAYLLFIFTSFTHAEGVYKKPLFLMGCDFEFTVVAKNQVEAERAFALAESEVKRIESLISSWITESQTSLINQNSGIKAVKVDRELIELIKRSIVISKLTDGAFDISYAAIDEIWDFNKKMEVLPTKKEIENSVCKVGYQKIELIEEKSTVFLMEQGMRIGFGGIGKGYAADQAKKILIENGFDSGIINASGDMSVWGYKPDGSPWKIAIKNPLSKEKAFALLPIENSAVVTSGDYEKYVEIEGKRYSHIIDPRSGMPAYGIISVTVFAPKAELADALATSVFVMGVEAGINRINQIPTVECIIVKSNGDIMQSNNIQIKIE